MQHIAHIHTPTCDRNIVTSSNNTGTIEVSLGNALRYGKSGVEGVGITWDGTGDDFLETDRCKQQFFKLVKAYLLFEEWWILLVKDPVLPSFLWEPYLQSSCEDDLPGSHPYRWWDAHDNQWNRATLCNWVGKSTVSCLLDRFSEHHLFYQKLNRKWRSRGCSWFLSHLEAQAHQWWGDQQQEQISWCAAAR